MRALRLLGTVLVAAAATVAIGVAEAAPAAAHASAGQDATDWRSTVTAVDPTTAVVTARTTDLGQHLEVTVATGHRLVVLGYSAEPYLRVDERGVWENERSPARWLNRSRSPEQAVPDEFDATAPPQWHRIGSGRTARWHDHRVHHTTGSTGGPWAVSVVVDDRPVTINGEIVEVPGPNTAVVTVAIAAGALVLIVAAGLLGARRGGMFVATIGAALAIAETFQIAGQWSASTDTVGSRVGAAVYGVGACAAALLAAWVAARRGTERAAPVLLLTGIAIAVCGGFARVTWLVHSQLPTALAPGVARAVVAAHLGVGIAFAAVGGVGAARRPESPLADESPSAFGG